MLNRLKRPNACLPYLRHDSGKYLYSFGPVARERPHDRTADLHTKIPDFRGFDSSRILSFKGWNSQAHRGSPGKLELSDLSRDNVREIGRRAPLSLPRAEA